MIGKKYNEVLKALEKNIEGKKNLEFAKNSITELSLAYIDEFTKITDNYTNKIFELEERILKLEGNIDNIDEETKIQLSETITCPYCNYDFLVEYNENNHEISCPKCNNLIELDWGEYDDDM